MRILAAADLHGARTVYEWMAELARAADGVCRAMFIELPELKQTVVAHRAGLLPCCWQG